MSQRWIPPINSGGTFNATGIWARMYLLYKLYQNDYAEMGRFVNAYCPGAVLSVQNPVPQWEPTWCAVLMADDSRPGRPLNLEVILNGTENFRHLLVDLAAVPPVPVNLSSYAHAGFWAVALAIGDLIAGTVAKYSTLARVTISGHSYGAAVGALIARMLKAGQLSQRIPEVHYVGYGQPHPFGGSAAPYSDPDFSIEVRKRFDVIANLPPNGAELALLDPSLPAPAASKLTKVLSWQHEGQGLLLDYNGAFVWQYDRPTYDADAWSRPDQWPDAHPSLTYLQCCEGLPGVQPPPYLNPAVAKLVSAAEGVAGLAAKQIVLATAHQAWVDPPVDPSQVSGVSTVLFGVGNAIQSAGQLVAAESVVVVAGTPTVLPPPPGSPGTGPQPTVQVVGGLPGFIPGTISR